MCKSKYIWTEENHLTVIVRWFQGTNQDLVFLVPEYAWWNLM